MHYCTGSGTVKRFCLLHRDSVLDQPLGTDCAEMLPTLQIFRLGLSTDDGRVGRSFLLCRNQVGIIHPELSLEKFCPFYRHTGMDHQLTAGQRTHSDLSTEIQVWINPLVEGKAGITIHCTEIRVWSTH
jgi:hypothetical protein